MTVIPEILTATKNALRAAAEKRFFRTERGYHGRFYWMLQAELDRLGLLRDGAILEIEYQKAARHHTRQRPDIVFHIPTEHSNADVRQHNFAVFALKRRATRANALAQEERYLATLDATRAAMTERSQRVSGLSESAEATLHAFRNGDAIRILEMEFRNGTGWSKDTYYLTDDGDLFAVARRRSDHPATRTETYYYGPGQKLRFYTAVAPPRNTEDAVLIDAAYEGRYFEQFVEAAKKPAKSVEIEWINRE